MDYIYEWDRFNVNPVKIIVPMLLVLLLNFYDKYVDKDSLILFIKCGYYQRDKIKNWIQ